MNFDRDDEKLETYLRQFRARAPRPLPGKARTAFSRRPAVLMAAAALVLVAVSLLVMRQMPEKVRPMQAKTAHAEPALQEISLVRLSRIAQQEPEKLDSHLDHLSTQLLPDVLAGHGVLKQLAHE
jgi:ferric-dicitrate binding protein FerR (iron transport regulator)